MNNKAKYGCTYHACRDKVLVIPGEVARKDVLLELKVQKDSTVQHVSSLPSHVPFITTPTMVNAAPP